jgi:hypothetical protein
MQIVGGEVRPEIGAVAEDRAVLHQAPVQEDLLALADVITRVDDVARRVRRPVRDRRVGLIGPVGEQDEDEEPDDDDEAGDLKPGLRDEQLALAGRSVARRHARTLSSASPDLWH